MMLSGEPWLWSNYTGYSTDTEACSLYLVALPWVYKALTRVCAYACLPIAGKPVSVNPRVLSNLELL